MSKQMLRIIIALAIVFGGILLWNLFKNYQTQRYFANFQPPAVTITAMPAKAESWQPYINAVGILAAVNGVAVSTQIGGIVKSINFNSGDMVKKGDLLVQIDDSVEQAEIQGNRAQVFLTAANLDRYKRLQEKKYAAVIDYDQALANNQQATANLNKTQAIIDQKHISAPFDGKIGIRLVNLGQYIAPGTQLVSLQSIDPIFVNFSVPEQHLKSVRTGQTVLFNVDTHPGVTFKGTLTAINSVVDDQTHNIQLQATIPNKEGQLYPGLFANIRVVLPEYKNTVVVPQTAIDASLFGSSVFVISEKGKDKEDKPIQIVNRRYVKTGEQRDNKVAILEGIKPGEWVVTSGQLKLDNGTRVVIDNKVTTSAVPGESKASAIGITTY